MGIRCSNTHTPAPSQKNGNLIKKKKLTIFSPKIKLMSIKPGAELNNFDSSVWSVVSRLHVICQATQVNHYNLYLTTTCQFFHSFLEDIIGKIGDLIKS